MTGDPKLDGGIRLSKSKSLIYPEVVSLFILGCISGFLVALELPSIGRSYAAFYTSDVIMFTGGFYDKGGVIGMVLAIILKNLFPVSILTFFPYILIVHHVKLGFHDGKSLKTALKLFSFCPIFAYGFAVYGLFLGHLAATYSVSTALNLLLTSMTHGWLEILVMLSAGSVGLNLIDRIRECERFREYIRFKTVLHRWTWLAGGVIMASVIEVVATPLLS